MNSRTHIKIQKSTMLVKKNYKINMLNIKNIIKLRKIIILQENLEVLHIVYINQSSVYLKKCP